VARAASGQPLRRAVALAIGLVSIALAVAAPAHGRPAAGFQRGFVLTGWKAGSYLGASTDGALRRAASGGSGHTAIFTQWFMDAPVSSSLAPDPERTPSDASIVAAATEARAAGLEITIKPQIGIRTGSWIGGAHPADLAAFWADYRTMLLHYADLADQVGASMLVVGTEMGTLSWDEAHWRPLIAEVRERFHGALTYAANYDEYARVPFWDALDYIGIDAYFQLADAGDPAPSAAELSAAWRSRGYLRSIGAVAERTGKRVVFTEIGYRGIRGTAVSPNIWAGSGITDVEAQANAYRAFYDAVAEQPWMAGVYWWEVNVDSWWVQDYSPLGKPAEQVIASWNGRAIEQPPGDVAPPAEVTPAAEVTPPADVAPPAEVTPPAAAVPTAEVAPPAGPALPAGAPSAAKRPSLRLRVTVSHGRVRGSVAPYVSGCGGSISLRLRNRRRGRWHYLRPPHSSQVRPDGSFARRLPSGRLRVRTVFESPCGSVSSGWATAR
jgi:hypothetical protein